MQGKCPSCKKSVSSVSIAAITASVPLGTTFKAISYNCTACHTVLSVAIDPIAVRTEIVAQVTDEVRKMLRAG